MTDNSYTVDKTDVLQSGTQSDLVKYDAGKLFNLCLNLYSGFPLLDKPRNYLDSLVGREAQILLISKDKFIHPENYDGITAETVIDMVKHSSTGIFCQQVESNRLENSNGKTVCAASLGLNKNNRNIAAAVLFDPAYGNGAAQKESYYELLCTCRELYTDLSKSRAVSDFLGNRDSYRYLVNYETGELVAKRLPTETINNNDELAESIFRQIQIGNVSESNSTTFNNQIKNLKITRFKLSYFEYLLFSFELTSENKSDKELEYDKLFRYFMHRIKNKLGSLQTASSQLILEEGNTIDKDDITLSEIIRSETEYIDLMISRTRQLLELEDPDFKQFDLIQMTKEILEKNKNKFNGDIALTIKSGPESCPVFGDTDLLKSALDEIIRNGFEAASELDVEIETSDKISITFNNKITEQMYDSLHNKTLDITEPYISLKPNQIGLGLSIASKIMSLHDGTIETGLNRNKGMITKIILPALTYHSHQIKTEKSR